MSDIPQRTAKRFVLEELERLGYSCEELADGNTVLICKVSTAGPRQQPARLLLPERDFEQYVHRRKPIPGSLPGDPRLRVLDDVVLDIVYALQIDMSPLIALGVRTHLGVREWFEERGPIETLATIEGGYWTANPDESNKS